MLGLGLSLTGGAVTRGGVSPSLDLDFMAGTMPAAVTFSRTSTATRFNSAGMLETVAAGVPRFDHDPVTLAPRGLLVEEARTNLVPGTMTGGTYWAVLNTSVAAGATAPDGTANAVTVTQGAHGVTNYGLTTVSAVPITASAPCTASVFVKAGTCTWFRMVLADAPTITISAQAWFNLTTGSVASSSVQTGSPTGISATIQNCGNGWLRCTLTATLAASATAALFLRTVSGDATSTDTGGKTMMFFNPGIEVGAFATSPILSTTTAASRAVDVATITNIEPWFSPAQGTLFAEFQRVGIPTGALPRIASFSDGATANLIEFVLSGTEQLAITTGGVAQGPIIAATSGGTALNRIAGAWANNDSAVSLNGAASVVDGTVTLPTVNRLSIGNRVDLTPGRQTTGYIRRIRYWQVRRPNSDLQQITAI